MSMDSSEVLDVLKQIRDEARQTNVRLDQTNLQLETLDGRVGQTNLRLESLEGHVGQTNLRLESLEGHVGQTNLRLESLEGHVEQTNLRLESLEGHVEQTNVRLDSLEGRFEFLERRVSKGFEQLAETVRETEGTVAAEVAGLARSMDQIRDLLSTKMDDHNLLIRLEGRVRLLESSIPHHPPE